MLKALLASTAIAVVGGYVLIAHGESTPLRTGALYLYSYVAPDKSCDFDPAACLERHGSELNGMEDKIGTAIAQLVNERRHSETLLNQRLAEQKKNQALLEDGRRHWQQDSSQGKRTAWRGYSYEPHQMERQLKLLYQEQTVIGGAVENLQKVITELDARLVDTRLLKSRIEAEHTMIASKVTLARTGALVERLDAISATLDKVSTKMKVVFEKNAAILDSLRTTRELDAANKEETAPDFQKWLKEDAAYGYGVDAPRSR